MKPLNSYVIAPLVLALAGSGIAMLGGCEEQWESNPGLEPAEEYQAPAPDPVQPAEPEGESMTEPQPEPQPLMPPLHEEPQSEADSESDPAQDEPATDEPESGTMQ